VILRLGALDEVTPTVIENLFACDLNYLQQFYRQINELESDNEVESASNLSAQPVSIPSDSE